MKVHWYDRVLIGLAGLVLVAAGIFAILTVSDVVDVVESLALDLLIGDSIEWSAGIYIISTLVTLWGAWLCVFSLRNLRSGQAKD